MRSFGVQATTAEIPAGESVLHGSLQVPRRADGLVLFAHGHGSSHQSPRNQRVAEMLHDINVATLLFDLVSPEEGSPEAFKPERRFDARFLAARLHAATRWARQQPETAELRFGYYGSGTGAAAALIAAASRGSRISALVTRGGRTDLAAGVIDQISTPTMLIVGSNDSAVAATNLETWAQLKCEKAIEIVPGASHLFEEPGALENVAALAACWFGHHFGNDAMY